MAKTMYTEKQIRKLIKEDKVNWYYISQFQKLSEDFIREFQDKVDWYYISQFQKNSENLIREFKDKVIWFYISQYQKLSEDFIREFKDKVNWDYISEYQKLSEDFIREFKDKVDWVSISAYQKLSEKFVREFNLEIKETCWIYKTKEEKLKYIKDNKLDKVYELVDDQYIIAYKSTRLDGYSVYNFQYKYEVGETYESHCDCNINEENSFGLSAWTKYEALGYHQGNLYKVKINIEDIGCFVHNNGKIRAKKITILEKLSNI
jgi:hypothetical protein